jgi:hypothetical protein
LFCNGTAFGCGPISFIYGIENPRVDGSIPPLATNKIKGLRRCKPFLFFAGVTPGLRFKRELSPYPAVSSLDIAQIISARPSTPDGNIL